MFEEFPHPKNKNDSFIFTNGFFQNTKNKDEKLKILEYSENLEGWSEEHTEVINDHIGNKHPIDVASRDMCKYLLKKNNDENNKIVLEIGCSSGNLIDHVNSINNLKYIGSDVIRKPIKKLANIYNNNPFIIFDILKNPFSKGICDFLIMLNVLEHIADDDSALAEANKLLKKDGLLILEVPSCKSLYDDYDKKLLHFRRYNMNELIKKIERAGFIIEKKTHLGFILFPIFSVVKIINKLIKRKNIIVSHANASNNILVQVLFKMEEKLRNFSLPFGIRCFVCARKK